MRIRFLTLSILAILAIGFVSYNVTHALFSDTGKSTNNTFSAAPVFPHMVINEVYYRIALNHRINNSEAGSEWIELYNPTNSSINLNGWSIKDNTSCDNIPGSPIIPSGGFAILTTHTESDFKAVWTSIPVGVIFIQSPTAIGNGLANNDELILRNGTCPSGGNIVDHISWGSNTNGLNPSIPMTSSGVSSERDPDGLDSNMNADFVSRNPPTPGI